MAIELIETDREFSDENVNELEEFLSKIPYSHLKALRTIERLPIIMHKNNSSYADSSPDGMGEQTRLSDDFYNFSKKGREFIFLHEMGHNYFDFRDENEGERSRLKWIGFRNKKEISHLLRIQWVDFGWNLNPIGWKNVKETDPLNEAHKDKYTYTLMYPNPNFCMGEWMHSKEGRIEKDMFQLGFRYDLALYSPKEEMADAYALFVMDRNKFSGLAEKDSIVKAKYDFIARCFKDGTKKEKINLKKRDKMDFRNVYNK
jgi:hypothetical protein